MFDLKLFAANLNTSGSDEAGDTNEPAGTWDWFQDQCKKYPREVASLLQFYFSMPFDGDELIVSVFLKDREMREEDSGETRWCGPLIPEYKDHECGGMLSTHLSFPNDIRRVYDELIALGMEFDVEMQKYDIEDEMQDALDAAGIKI